jgi:hypothetical protein
MARVIKEINPDYTFPVALVSTLFEVSKKQTFFAQHLSSLTDVSINQTHYSNIATFLEHLAFSAISNTKSNSNGNGYAKEV